MNHFFFLHVPKTAGMSIHRFLEQSAGPYLHLKYPHELSWSSAQIWNRFRGCGGHLNCSIAKRNGLLDAFTLTFLRDPIDRVLSQYEFTRQSGLGDRPDSIIARTTTLSELLRTADGVHESFSNAQTLALSGLPLDAASAKEHLASALENLSRFDFVGTTETIATDIPELSQLMGFDAPASIPHENQSPRHLLRGKLAEEVIALLEETQALDLALYAQALELKPKRKARPFYFTTAKLVGWPPQTLLTGSGEAEITQVTIHPSENDNFRPGQNAELSISWVCTQPLDGVTLGIRIEDLVGNYIVGTNSLLLTKCSLNFQVGSSSCLFQFPMNMGAGRYSITVALHRGRQVIYRMEPATVFEVAPPLTPYREGMVDIDALFTVQHGASSGPLTENTARLVSFNLEGSPLVDLVSDEIRITAIISNGSEQVLSSNQPCLIFVSYHWIQIGGDIRVQNGIRTPLPQPIWAGKYASFQARVLPPPQPGAWRLQVRLVQEGVRWYEGQGFENAMPHDLYFEYRKNQTLTLIGRPHAE